MTSTVSWPLASYASVRYLEPWEPTPFDVVQYSYALTPAGSEAAAGVSEATRQVASHLVRTVRKAGAWNQASLSLAAKVMHLRRSEPSVGDEQIPTLAREFGWRMSDSPARRGTRLLHALAGAEGPLAFATLAATIVTMIGQLVFLVLRRRWETQDREEKAALQRRGDPSGE